MANHFVAFWNVENFFAPENCQERPDWLATQMASALDGWSEELFLRKRDQLAQIITQMNGGAGPDILGVCEVENRVVLDALCSRLNQQLPERDYAPVHADSLRDLRGIDTAFLHDRRRYTHDPESLFSYFVVRRTGTRDITQATFTTSSGVNLVLLCNHWPARSGGIHESRGYRMTAGETLAYFHQRIRDKLGPATPILAMGDFNDDPYDESLLFHAEATRERGDVERSLSVPRLYNLAWRYLRQGAVDHRGDRRCLEGTLYYNGNGHLFDQLLAGKGLLLSDSPLRVIEETARIEAFPAMVDHRVTQGPIRFGLPKGNIDRNINVNGFSDHFPVSVTLTDN